MSVTWIAEINTDSGVMRCGLDQDLHFVTIESLYEYKGHIGVVFFAKDTRFATHDSASFLEGFCSILLKDRPLRSWGLCTEDIEAWIQAHSEHDLPYLRMEPDELLEFLTERGVEFTLINQYEGIAK